MHCGFLSTQYPPAQAGGIGSSIQSLAREMVREGHRVTVLGWGREQSFEDHQVRVRFLGETSIPRMGWLLNRRLVQSEIARLVREEDLRIVESPDWCGPSAGLRARCPLVVRCHGSDSYFARFEERRPRHSVALAERLALRSASSVAAVSAFTAKESRKIFDLPAADQGHSKWSRCNTILARYRVPGFAIPPVSRHRGAQEGCVGPPRDIP